jgi:hypothetical protein
MQDPREEVMTLERVLLQTIKFDLQVRHLFRVFIMQSCGSGFIESRSGSIISSESESNPNPGF